MGVPTTFIMRSSAQPIFVAFRVHCEAVAAAGGSAAAMVAAGEHMPAGHCARGMWIVKPEKLLGGQGIELVASVDEVATVLDRVSAEGLRTAEGGAVAAGANWIVQKYIERPLLLGGRKFDVRVLALVTSSWDVYVFEHGFIRMTSVPYSLERESDSKGDGGGVAGDRAGVAAAAAAAISQFSSGSFAKVAHITNHCYQVTASGYGAREPSNLLSFDQLQTALDLAMGEGAVSVRGQLWPRWAEAILNMFAAARGSSEAGARSPAPAATGAGGAGGGGSQRHWFEIVGVDFVVDEHMRSWLIEANTTPGLEGHCAYADAVYARVVEEAYVLAVDPLFPLRSGAFAPPMPDAAYADSAVAALPWAADVQRVPLPAWVSKPWGGWAPAPTNAGCAGARQPAPRPHPAPTSPRSNCWQLVWSERSADLRTIPHQEAMSHDAINSAAVEELLKAEAAAGAAGVSDADAAALAARHGLGGLLSAVEQTRSVAEAELRAGASADVDADVNGSAATVAGGEVRAQTTPFWRACLRRFIRRNDDAWLYPIGAPATLP